MDLTLSPLLPVRQRHSPWVFLVRTMVLQEASPFSFVEMMVDHFFQEHFIFCDEGKEDFEVTKGYRVIFYSLAVGSHS